MDYYNKRGFDSLTMVEMVQYHFFLLVTWDLSIGQFPKTYSWNLFACRANGANRANWEVAGSNF